LPVPKEKRKGGITDHMVWLAHRISLTSSLAKVARTLLFLSRLVTFSCKAFCPALLACASFSRSLRNREKRKKKKGKRGGRGRGRQG